MSVKRNAVLPVIFALYACTGGACRWQPADEAPSSSAVGPSGVPGGAQSAPTAAHAATPSTPSEKSIVAEVMRSQYGDAFDSRHDCWDYAPQQDGDALRYCMQAGNAEIVATGATRRLNFLATNRLDIDDADHAYGHAVPGLVGAFEVELTPAGQWKVVSASRDMTYGTNGDCGCKEAAFVKLGADYHGWMFASGGVWQGVVVLDHHILAPHEGGFKDLAGMPKITEGDQDTEYSLVVDGSHGGAPHYPLLMTEEKHGTKVDTSKIEFDRTQWRYDTDKE